MKTMKTVVVFLAGAAAGLVGEAVRRGAAAHGGTAVFGQNTPCGAKTAVWLPVK